MHAVRRCIVAVGTAALGFLPPRLGAQESLVSAEDRGGGRLEIHELAGTPAETISVWLPPGYQESARRYPVAYLLHGSGQNYTAFTDAANAPGSVVRLADEGRIEPMILAMPTRWRTDIPSWMSPSFWGFVATDVVDLVDRNYRTVPARSGRAVGGFSMGGMDAVMVGLLRPDVFGHVGGMDGASVPCPPCELDNRELRERLQLHQQFRFPLSLWIEWGTGSFLPPPRPVLDLLGAIRLPYTYLETGDDHTGSLRNATDDFLVFFSDGLRAAAAEPPTSGRVTEHFVAVAGSVLDIEVDLGGAPADPAAGLRVDLSALGLEPVLLDRDGRGGYTGTLRLPDGVRNGVYALPVARVDGAGGAEHAYGIRVTVLPSSDLVVLDEDVGPGWSIGSTGG
ncbi:MAG: alpha/beta hydrolase-fold protein, partial [Candidatus Latescibacterota bacterium]